MNRTGIEYLDYSWNPLAMRCTRVSSGCKHCWHLRMADRLAANPKLSTDVRAAYAGDAPPLLVGSRLDEPLRVKKPSIVGGQFMGDLFHEDVTIDLIESVFETIEKAYWHIFLILTKRIEYVLDFAADMSAWNNWQYKNVYWGTSVESQAQANERIPQLLEIPGKHWLSIEPMLEEIEIPLYCRGCSDEEVNCDPGPWCNGYDAGVDWITLGAETGPGARPFKNEWALSVLEQCKAANVPFFIKKVEGGKEPPLELMIREYPAGVSHA